MSECSVPALILLAACVGCVAVVRFVYPLALHLLLSLRTRFAPFTRRFGDWAVLTGCTDGIGEAMAVRLARKGMNVFLISRNAERLDATKKKVLAANSSVSVRTFVMDFSRKAWDERKFSQLTAEIQALPNLGVLYNNVGVAYPTSLYFEELETSTIDDLLEINIRAPFRLTHAVLTKMKTAKKGAIIFTGSGASTIPSDPLLAGYAAAKAAIQGFCESLQPECVPHNILVQCHAPLLITTKLSGVRKPSATIATPDQYADAAVEAIRTGVASFWLSSVYCPFYAHRFLTWGANQVPLGVWHAMQIKMMLALRKKWYAKHKVM